MNAFIRRLNVPIIHGLLKYPCTAFMLFTILLCCPPEAQSASGTAVSTLTPKLYSPGVATNVSILVTPEQGVFAYAVEDSPPAGWTASDIGQSGAWDDTNKKVKWGPFFDNTVRTFTYKVTPPVAERNPGTFAGTASFDGAGVSITGDRSSTVSSTEVTISDLAAEQTPSGVKIRWRTGLEIRNLGFNIHRKDNIDFIKLNPSILAGSSLIVGAETVLSAGNAYEWIDPEGRNGSEYFLEDVDLSGKSMWHGPVMPEYAAEKPDAGRFAARTPEQLSGLGNLSQTTGRPRSSSAALPTNSAERAARQSALASGSALKMSVAEEGWYRITQSQLLAAGLDPSVDPRSLHVYVDGEEVPILVRGEQDGRLDLFDSLEFYGIGLDIPSTNKRTYWLVSNGEPARRIQPARASGHGTEVTHFPDTIEKRDRTLYAPSVLNGEAENFYGAVIGTTPIEQTLLLPEIYPGGPEPLMMEVILQGLTQSQHKVMASFNDLTLGAVTFSGQDRAVGIFRAPSSTAIKFGNRVGLVSESKGTDACLLESIRITYSRRFKADGDQLRFSLSAGTRASIGGFSNPSIQVFDITNPGDVYQLGGDITLQGTEYSVQVSTAGRGQRKILALSDSRMKSPAEIAANRPSRLINPANAADMVIVSHPIFEPSLEPLRALRASQGLQTTIVNVEDVYDEFSYGHKTPRAIRDFLEYAASSWSKSPRYVLLVGDAGYTRRITWGRGISIFCRAL